MFPATQKRWAMPGFSRADPHCCASRLRSSASSTNILINPLHPDASAFVPRAIRPFVFDPRLWTR